MKRGLTVVLAALVLLTGCELRYRAISKLVRIALSGYQQTRHYRCRESLSGAGSGSAGHGERDV